MSNNDDLLLVGSLDQSVPVDGDWAMSRIDEVLKRSLKERNADLALDMCKQLVAIGQVVGIGLAKALYFLQKNWEKYKIDEAFEDYVFDKIGKHRHTVERYVKIWGMFDNAVVPQDYVEEFQQKSVNELAPIANAVYQGYEISAEEWEKLSEAPDENVISKIVREDIKNQPPRKNTLQLFLDREGTIWAYQDSHRYFVGSLEISATEEPIQQAIERIVGRSRMMKQ
jgi:hypothetical protein